MAAAAGLMNHSTVTGQALAGTRVSAMASSNPGTNGTSNTTSSSVGITANDFLTLLVTEMKNQDPTANTDPNEYINQLVNVNSLQQLISINETLTGALGSSNSNTNALATGRTAQAYTNMTDAKTGSAAPGNSAVAETTLHPASPGVGSTGDSAMKALIGRFTQGNLSVPESNPAAQRLAHALAGRTGGLPTAK